MMIDRLTDRPANWEYWNKRSPLSIDQCIYLTIGVEPGAPLSKKKQAKYDEILEKAKKAQADGSFPKPVAQAKQ